MNYFSYRRELSELSKKKDKERKEFAQKIEEARKEGGSAKAHEVSQTERIELDFTQEDIAILKTNYLWQKINKTIYSMPPKPYATGQDDFWQQSHTGEWYLTEKGCIKVHNLLEKVSKEKREKYSFLVSIVFGFMGLLIALISVVKDLFVSSPK